jgi:8-oxo-dGTP diphosphatase
MKDERDSVCRPSNSTFSLQPSALPAPTPVGIALIRRGDKYLIRRRPVGTVYAGYWEFPGGKCEPGEDAAAATARECYEEIGLRVVVGPLRHTTIYRYDHGEVELFFFDCCTEDENAEPVEGRGFCWVPAAELKALRFPEANEAVIDELSRAGGERSPA